MPLIIRSHIKYDPPKPKAPEPTKREPGIPRTCKRWTEQDDALIRKSYDPFNVEALGIAMNRTVQAIRTRASALGLTMDKSKAASMSKRINGSEWSR